jgi:hypothetical protein
VELLVGFDDVRLLAEAGTYAVAGELPRLRLVNCGPRDTCLAYLERLSPSVAARVVVDADPRASQDRLDLFLTADGTGEPRTTAAGQVVPTLRWSALPAAYNLWLSEEYGRFRARFGLYTPDGLVPPGVAARPWHLELLAAGDTSSFAATAVAQRRFLTGPLEVITSVVTDGVVPEAPEWIDASVYFAPMPAAGASPAEPPDELLRALDTVAAARRGRPLFVAGVVVPLRSPEGSFVFDLSGEDFTRRCVLRNDALVDWCAHHVDCYYLDLDAIAATTGKVGISAETYGTYADRPRVLPYLTDSDLRLQEFEVLVLRWVAHRLITLAGEGRVETVVFDLDERLCRALADNRAVASWYSLWQGLLETIGLLARRGITTAVCSSGDESLRRSGWTSLLESFTEDTLALRLDLDALAAARFVPGSIASALPELLGELGATEAASVVVTADAHARDEIARAMPAVRVLGAELAYVRSELLFSPYTQRTTRPDARAAGPVPVAVAGRQGETR